MKDLKVIEMVIVGYWFSDSKWPDTNDTNYDDVLARRRYVNYEVNGDIVQIKIRWYPMYRAYVASGDMALPMPHIVLSPPINNTRPPSQKVLDAMVKDLTDIANDGCTICFWEHTYQCYPYVAQNLKNIFKHSLLIHADDCPGSTEIKTEPVAKFFDSAIHCNVIWNMNGELTESLYRRLGVKDTYYATLSTSGGLLEGLSACASNIGQGTRFGNCDMVYFGPGNEVKLDLDARIRNLRDQKYSNDMVFVGGISPGARGMLNSPDITQLFVAAGLRTKIHGCGMRDGELLPKVPSELAKPVAVLYLDSFSVLNLQYIGLMATRPYDAWATGTLLIQWDPVHEMDHLGVKAGVHYAAYDGTFPGLIKTVKYYQAHMDETEAIIRAGYEVGQSLPKEHNVKRALEHILEKFWYKWA